MSFCPLMQSFSGFSRQAENEHYNFVIFVLSTVSHDQRSPVKLGIPVDVHLKAPEGQQT